MGERLPYANQALPVLHSGSDSIVRGRNGQTRHPPHVARVATMTPFKERLLHDIESLSSEELLAVQQLIDSFKREDTSSSSTAKEKPSVSEAALLSEEALAKDWTREEEEEAWSHLQPDR